MFETINSPGESPSSIGLNITTKAALLSRAKSAIEDGEQSLRDAAEALALALQDFDATQREIAAAVGKSVAWVNRLLQWHKEGCLGTPFGPGSRASRARRRCVQAPERAPSPKADVGTAEKQYAKQEVEGEDSSSSAVNPLAAFKAEVDYWFVHMDYSAKCEAVAYVLTKGKVRVS